MQRTASAHWSGGLKDGNGTISSQSGVLNNNQYSFSTRFESGIGTNPEELIAAAHAGCFTMALSAELGKLGMTAESLDTKATLTLEFIDGKPTITTSHLEVTARIPGADRDKFQEAAHNAELGCPVSRVLNAKVSMVATLNS
jgi:osmotically inducible protein OsmC